MADPYPEWTEKGTWSISENHPGSGYQVKFTIPFYTGMATTPKDYRDIRFSDSADNILPYWIESYSDTQAIVWVKLTAATSGTLHYGNTSATDASSIDDTMEFGYSPSGSSIDASKFDLYTGTSVTVSNGTVILDSGSVESPPNYGQIRSKTAYGTGIVLRARIKQSTATDHSKIGFGNQWINYPRDNTLKTMSAGFRADGTVGGYLENDVNNFNSLDGSSYTADTYYIFEVTRNSDGSMSYTVDGGTAQTTTLYPWTDNGYLVLANWGNDAGVLTVDWVVIRKYTSTAPTYTIADSVETQPPETGFSTTKIYTVQFTDISTNDPTSWLWDFDDGNTSTDQNPTHTFVEAGTYTVVLTATNEAGSDDYSVDVTVSESGGTNTVTIVRVYEMDHLAGSTIKHAFQILKSDNSGYSNTCTTPVISVYVDGTASPTNPQSWTISAFDNTMSCFWITVPDSVDSTAFTVGQNIGINISCTEGEGNVFLNIVSESSGGGATAQQVWEYATRTVTGGSTTGGSEIIITGYTHDASEKTLTITDTSHLTLKVEQVKKIFNLTKGCEIYDSGNPRKRRLFMETEEERAGIDISITGAVISYIETATMADEDKIMIVVAPASA